MKSPVCSPFLALAACTAVLSANPAPMEVDAGVMETPDRVTVFAGIDLASAYIYGDGEIVNDALVIQPGFGIGWKAFGHVSMELSVWGNYATEHYGDMTRNHGFNEIDVSLGMRHETDDGLSISLALATWQYPNMEDWKGEEVLILGIAQTVGLVTVGADVKPRLSGDAKHDVECIPFVEIARDITDDVAASIKAEFNYTWGDASDSGWTAYVLTARLEAFGFHAYASYWGQLSDAIYTDAMHAEKNRLFGIGYAIDY